jgi:endo-1,4-beta-xylanase
MNAFPFWLLVLLCSSDGWMVEHGRLLAQAKAQQLTLNLSPPAFHTGGVFYADGGTTNDVDYINLNLREFDTMTASLYMGFGRWPAPTAAIQISDWEVLVDKLKANNKVIHGEILVYPNYNLDIAWWVQQANSLVESRMYQFIDTVVQSRKGDVWAWDVVNEIMGDDGDTMDQDGVRTVFWTGVPIKEYAAMGQSFIANAFHRAHGDDPNALLILADYGCEEDDPDNNNEKSDRLFRFMSKLKKEKVPIDGVGLQFHVSSVPGMEPNYTNVAFNFQRFRNAGFSIFITEMDVKSYNTTNLATVNQAALQQAAARQALVYGRIMEICLNEPACKCLLMWDDAEYNSREPNQVYSWLQPYRNGNDLPVYWYPSPFWDINPNHFSPKPAWYAMQNALVNFTGVYRVTSLWTTSSSYLIRNGTSTTPSYQVGLYTLNGKTNLLTSMKWRFERVNVGVYRIACTWGYSTGYLTRLGLPDPVTSVITATSQIQVQALEPSWESQLWYVHYVFGNEYIITSQWGDDGTLTRLGSYNQNGVLQPTNQVYLDANHSWASQIWRLERVWSAGDTKTPAEAFWL